MAHTPKKLLADSNKILTQIVSLGFNEEATNPQRIPNSHFLTSAVLTFPEVEPS